MYVHVAATQPARSQSIAEDKSWAENACINQFQTRKGGIPSHITLVAVSSL